MITKNQKKSHIGSLNFSLFVLLLISLDQLVKYLIRTFEPSYDFYVVAFHYVTNTGSSFSMFEGYRIFLISASVILLGIMIYYFIKYAIHNYPENYFVLMVIAGGIGNLIDRVIFGFVTDFIDIKIWPIFNFADMFITIGVIGILIYYYRSGKMGEKSYRHKTI